MDLKRSADLTLSNEYDLYCSYREGYCQEMEHHLNLLQILLLAAGPLAVRPLPCLWARKGMGCPRLGGCLGVPKAHPHAPGPLWGTSRQGPTLRRAPDFLQLYQEEGNKLLKPLADFIWTLQVQKLSPGSPSPGLPYYKVRFMFKVERHLRYSSDTQFPSLGYLQKPLIIFILG